MKTKDYLLNRQAQILEALKGYDDLRAELRDIEKALAALEPKCTGCPGGCDICRTGPLYR